MFGACGKSNQCYHTKWLLRADRGETYPEIITKICQVHTDVYIVPPTTPFGVETAVMLSLIILGAVSFACAPRSRPSRPRRLWLLVPSYIVWRLGTDISAALHVAARVGAKEASGKKQ